MTLVFSIPVGLTPEITGMVAVILGASGMMSGLSGFGFSAIGAICLWLLPPTLAVPLLMTLSTANQLMSIGQLKADMKPLREWWPDGPGPYLLGGLFGIPVGLWVLHSLPTPILMSVFGGFLVGYAAYSLLKPDSLRVLCRSRWPLSILVGMVGGVIGGFTAFPGAAVVIWSGLRGLSKRETRAIVQPYILGLQIVALAILAVGHPATFGGKFWFLLTVTLPIVLPCTFLGVRLYKTLSEINFRRIAFMLLGTSGFGILAKGLMITAIVGAAMH
jgi:hypothetical protein